MAKSNRSDVVLTPHFRVRFPRLFQPKVNDQGKEKWSVMMLIPKSSDISGVKGAVLQVAQAAWPDNWQAILNANSPIKDGDTVTYTRGDKVGQLKKTTYPEMAGMWVIDATSNQAPGCVDQNVQPIMEPGAIYDGCWAHAKVNAFTYSVQGNSGVGIGLQVLQKVRDDDRIGGSAMNAASEFAPIADPSMVADNPVTQSTPAPAPTAPQAAPVQDAGVWG